MPLIIGGVIAGVGALAGGAMSANASKSAANQQSAAASAASQQQLNEFNTINQQEAPYRQSGYGALNSLNARLGLTTSSGYSGPAVDDINKQLAALSANPANMQEGAAGDAVRNQIRALQAQLPDAQAAANDVTNKADPNFGQFTHQFGASDLNANLAPNYQFMLDQGLGQARNTANATGGLINGNTLQGLNTFAQNYAQNGYQQAYNNYNNNQSNIFNRLSSIAGLAQAAQGQTNTAGQNATNQSTGYLTSGAAAQAAGTVGQANAYSGTANTLGGLASWYGPQMNFRSGGGSQTGYTPFPTDSSGNLQFD